MKKNKDRWIIGLALFSMFFGAGNVIFPPYLGMESASMWFPAFACYYMADIGLAVLAIFAMLKCDSDIDGITRRVGRVPAFLLSCVIVLCVGPLLAVPRTAATTFEMSVAPLFPGVSPVVCSVLFFALIFVLCVRESSVVDIVGKFLTPALFIGLLIVIIRGIIAPLGGIAAEPRIPNVIIEGIYSGYQTMDVLGALVFGVIIFKTAADKGYTELKERRQVIGAASVIAGLGLLIVYGGLAYLGATSSTLYGGDVTRAELVLNIVRGLMGNIGTVIFGVVVALACITTAIALVSSTGTYFSRITKNKLPYGGVVAVICIFSAVVSNVGLDGLVSISTPILSIVYAPALTLIFLTLFGRHIQNDNVFKGAALGAFVVSVLEMLSSYGLGFGFIHSLPLSTIGFAWLIPAMACGIVGAFIKKGDKVKQ